MRRMAIGPVASVLAVSVSSTAAAFDTPEAAVREYLEGVANADVEPQPHDRPVVSHSHR